MRKQGCAPWASGAAGHAAQPLRTAMAGVHTWAGLLFGWLLYFMFVTGTLGYLDSEIDRWMRPELPPARYPLPPAATAQHALDYLQTHASAAQRWMVQMPVDRNEPYLRVEWQPADPGQSARSDWLDAQTGARIAVRETGGGQTLYQMHWRLHYLPQAVAEWTVAFASMALFLALLTGVVVHRRFFADFFTVRLGKGQRSWLDVHNLASVATLPFQLMISYSGLVFLMFSFMPLIATAWYGLSPGVERAFYRDLFPPLAVAPATGERVAPVPMVQVLEQAKVHWQGAEAAVIDIRHPGDAHARIHLTGNFAAGPVRSAGTLVFDGVSGRLLAERAARQSGPRTARDLLLGLHEGLFAKPALRSMYLLSGLLGCAMIATGMVLWTVKRRQRAARSHAGALSGLVWMKRLNPGVIFGLPIAIAAYFWANRLLPVGMPSRAESEVHVLFGVWIAMLLCAALGASRRVWQVQSGVAALAFAALPVLNMLTTHRHLGWSLPAGDWVMAGLDLGAVALGCSFALGAWVMHRRGSSP